VQYLSNFGKALMNAAYGTIFHMRRATPVDPAKAAGVSPLTVSRTLSGYPYIA
jgi:hypothetical protein